MAKTIREVLELFEQHIRNHSRLNKKPELTKEQALAEIARLLEEAKPDKSTVAVGGSSDYINGEIIGYTTSVQEYYQNIKKILGVEE